MEDQKYLISLLKEENCPKWVIDHSIGVCKKANEIAINFKDDVDLNLLTSGALLHDIGRSKSNGIDHGIIGYEIAIDLGFSEKLANIIERHIGVGLTKYEALKFNLPLKNYIPLSLEERIVSHADNLYDGVNEVGINFTIDKWMRKNEISNKSILKLKKNHEELVLQFK
ncbi:HD domain-containing protein [Methanobrevibacter curvatus]|nr:HD domain-containing protein [Methanobrevibacter curvatus]